MTEINDLVLKRLMDFYPEEELPPGWFLEKIDATFNTHEKAEDGLKKIKDVIKSILTLKKDRAGWPEVDEWRNVLPLWFVESFRPEFTQEELDHMMLTKQWSKEWTLKNWLACYKDKVWEFWNASLQENKICIEILVDGHPFSIEEFHVLVEKCGGRVEIQ